MGKRKTTETQFANLAKNAGFIVKPGKSIRIEKPVKDKNGLTKKIVTTPDFFITDPKNDLNFHIEVTDSSGNTPHKSAQKRVIDSAGIQNYVVITGNQIEKVQKLLSPKEQKEILLQFFHLALLDH